MCLRPCSLVDRCKALQEGFGKQPLSNKESFPQYGIGTDKRGSLATISCVPGTFCCLTAFWHLSAQPAGFKETAVSLVFWCFALSTACKWFTNGHQVSHLQQAAWLSGHSCAFVYERDARVSHCRSLLLLLHSGSCRVLARTEHRQSQPALCDPNGTLQHPCRCHLCSLIRHTAETVQLHLSAVFRAGRGLACTGFATVTHPGTASTV
jgi:hypothetical protein